MRVPEVSRLKKFARAVLVLLLLVVGIGEASPLLAQYGPRPGRYYRRPYRRPYYRRPYYRRPYAHPYRHPYRRY